MNYFGSNSLTKLLILIKSKFSQIGHKHNLADISDITTTLEEINCLQGVSSNIQTQIDLKANSTSLTSHISNSSNPHNVTKSQLGLGNVNNTSDISKPVSTATQNAIDASYEQSTGYTDTAISNLINGAPTTLDTLAEIADAMAADESIVQALSDAIGTKANETDFNAHATNSTIHITANERALWNSKASTDIVTLSSDGLMSFNDKLKLNGIESEANKYIHPNETAYDNGLYKITINSLGHVISATAITKSDITALGIPAQDTNTTYSTFKGATSSIAGSSGLVPAPVTSNTAQYLRGDGTWATPPDTNTTYGVATTSVSGLMSADMVTKLNGIATGANAYTLPTASSTLGGVKTTSTVTSTSGLTACPIISGIPYYKDTNTTYTLSSFGLTANATELNYCDGVTSNIQTQLNGKLGSSANATSATKLATARTINGVSFNGSANITTGAYCMP